MDLGRLAAVAANILFYLTHGLFMFPSVLWFSKLVFLLLFSSIISIRIISLGAVCGVMLMLSRVHFFFSFFGQRRVFRVCWRAITCPRNSLRPNENNNNNQKHASSARPALMAVGCRLLTRIQRDDRTQTLSRFKFMIWITVFFWRKKISILIKWRITLFALRLSVRRPHADLRSKGQNSRRGATSAHFNYALITIARIY